MEYRNWNKNGARTSLLGFGCMRFPTTADGRIAERGTNEELLKKDGIYASLCRTQNLLA